MNKNLQTTFFVVMTSTMNRLERSLFNSGLRLGGPIYYRNQDNETKKLYGLLKVVFLLEPKSIKSRVLRFT